MVTSPLRGGEEESGGPWWRRPLVVVCLYLFLSLVIMRSVLLTPGFIGFQVDWNIPPFVEQLSQWSTQETSSWLPIGFGSPVSRETEVLLRLALGIFPLLGLDGEAATKVLGVLLFFISGVSAYYLARTFGLRFKPSLVAGFFYLSAPPLFTYFITGFLTYDTSYVITPLALAFFSKSVVDSRIIARNVVITALLYTFAIVHLQFSFLLLFLFLFYLLFSGSWRASLRYVVVTGVVVIIAVLIYSPLILTGIYSLTQTSLDAPAASASWIAFKNPPLVDALTLKMAGYDYFRETAEATPLASLWTFASFLIPVLAFLSVIRYPTRKVFFFATLSVLAIFYLTGASGPFGEIYRWLFVRVPVLSLLRNINYLFVFPVLSYSLLIGVLLSSAETDLKRRSVPISRKTIVRIGYFFVLFVLILYLWPAYLGNFGGRLATHSLDSSEDAVISRYVSTVGDFRTLQLPMDQPTSYRRGTTLGINAFDFPFPFGVFMENSARGRYRAYIGNLLYHDQTANLGYSLAWADVPYVVMNNNLESRYPKFIPSYNHLWLSELMSNRNLNSVLQRQGDLSPTDRGGGLDVYRNTKYVPAKIHAAKEPLLVAGQLSSLDQQSYLHDYRDSARDIIFTSQLGDVDTEALKGISKVYVQDNEYMDLVAGLLPARYRLEPGNYVNPFAVDANLGWVQVFSVWWWLDPGINALGDAALTLAKDTLSLQFRADSDEEYDLWAKAYFNSQGSSLDFGLDGRSIANIDTRAEAGNYRWVSLGARPLTKGEHRITVASEAGKNALAGILAVPKAAIARASNEAAELTKNRDVSLVVSNNTEGVKDTIFVPNDGDYALNIGVRPDLLAGQSCALTEEFTEERTLREWALSARNITVPSGVEMGEAAAVRKGLLVSTIGSSDSNGLLINAYFDSSPKEQEYLQLNKKVGPINLNGYPYIAWVADFENRAGQAVELVLGVDLNGDELADASLVVRPSPDQPVSVGGFQNTEGSCSINEDVPGFEVISVRDQIGKLKLEPGGTLNLVDLGLRLTKKEAYDSAKQNDNLRGWYSFWLRSLAIFKLDEAAYAESKEYGLDTLSGSGDPKDWQVSGTGVQPELAKSGRGAVPRLEFKGQMIGEELAKLQLPVNNIDLRRYPWFSLDYDLDSKEKLDLQVELGIDTNGDGRVDQNVIQSSQNYLPGKIDFDVSGKLDVGVIASSTTGEGRDSSIQASNLVDGRFGQRSLWMAGAVQSYFQIDLKAPRNIDKVVWSRDRGASRNDGVPRDYVLSTSEDGKRWNRVKVVQGSRLVPGEAKVDIFAPTRARYMRMDITQTTDDRPPALDEFEVFDTAGNIVTRNPSGAARLVDIGIQVGSPKAGDAKKEEITATLRINRVEVFRKTTIPVSRAQIKEPYLEIDGKPIQLKSGSENPIDGMRWFGSPTKIRLGKGDHDLRIASSDGVSLVRLVEFKSAALSSSDVASPEVTYTKLSSTKYKAHVEGAKAPFLLVFQESYHSAWQAEIDGQRVQNHFPINLFANGYYIERTGTYDVIIEFMPERWFRVGVAIATITVVLCFLSLIVLPFLPKGIGNRFS